MIFYVPGWNYEVFFFFFNKCFSSHTIPLKSQHSFTVRMNREGKKYTSDLQSHTVYNLTDEVKLSRSSVNKYTGSR